MSIEPLRCTDCNLVCEYESLIPLPSGEETSFGVSWKCPRCKQRSLDICPIGPLVPTDVTCLNCGHPFDSDTDHPVCGSCGLSRRQADELLPVGPLPYNFIDEIQAAFGEGRFRFGLAMANKALMADELREDAWHVKTTFLAKLGFQQSLAEVFKHMIALGIGSATLSYGSLLYQKQEYKQAARLYCNFLDARPDDDLAASVMANLANAVSVTGDDAEAERLYRSAIEREPHRATHYMNYVLLLKKQGRIDDAFNCIDMGLDVSSENEHTVRLLQDRAFLYAEQDRGEEALESIERALNLGAEGIRSRYLYGRALALIGRLEEAREQIQWVLNTDPGNSDATQAIKLIDHALQR